MDFDRSGGFWIDSVSKSGTSEFHGDAGYQFQTASMSADLNSGILSRYEQDRSWWNASLGGPILTDHLFFYGSYYRPGAAERQPGQPVRRRFRPTTARATKVSAS